MKKTQATPSSSCFPQHPLNQSGHQTRKTPETTSRKSKSTDTNEQTQQNYSRKVEPNSQTESNRGNRPYNDRDIPKHRRSNKTQFPRNAISAELVLLIPPSELKFDTQKKKKQGRTKKKGGTQIDRARQLRSADEIEGGRRRIKQMRSGDRTLT